MYISPLTYLFEGKIENMNVADTKSVSDRLIYYGVEFHNPAALTFQRGAFSAVLL